jgi:maleylpyruvate isomerase
VGEVLAGFVDRPGVPALDVTDTDTGLTRRIGPSGPAAPAGPPPPAVTGDTGALALWLTGRSDGTGLATSGDLPVLPAWL